MSPSRLVVAAALAALLLAGCGRTVQAPSMPQPAAQPPVAPASLLAQVREAGRTVADSLDVQPLRDPQVEDLLQTAARLEGEGDFAAAAQRIDQALAISDRDPELLQRRAEYALPLGDWAGAQELAMRSFELGPRLGPLCRRNWTTMRLAYEHAEAEAAAATARQRVAECTIEPPVRM